MENDLKKMGIDIDDPSFQISDFDVPNPRPPKNRGYDGRAGAVGV